MKGGDDIACVDLNHCIALGGGDAFSDFIFSTANSGSTWKVVVKRNSPQFTSIACGKRGGCEVVGGNELNGPIALEITVSRHGRTWQKVP